MRHTSFVVKLVYPAAEDGSCKTLLVPLRPGCADAAATAPAPPVVIGRAAELPAVQRVDHKYLSRRHVLLTLVTTAAGVMQTECLSVEQVGKNPTFFSNVPLHCGHKLVFTKDEVTRQPGATVELSFPPPLRLPKICITVAGESSGALGAPYAATAKASGGAAEGPTTLLVVPTVEELEGGRGDDDDDDDFAPPPPVSLRQVRLEQSLKVQAQEEEETRRQRERDADRARQEAAMTELHPSQSVVRKQQPPYDDDDDDDDADPPKPVTPLENPSFATAFAIKGPQPIPVTSIDVVKAWRGTTSSSTRDISASHAATAKVPQRSPSKTSAPAAGSTMPTGTPARTAAPVSAAAPAVRKGGTGWWEWKSSVNKDDADPKSWRKYPREVAEKLETAFRKDGGKCATVKLDSTYSVCFDDVDFGMVQFRNDDRTRWRAVRRRGGEVVPRPMAKPVRCCATADSSSDESSSSGPDEYRKDSFLVSDTSEDESDSSFDSESDESFDSTSSDSEERRRKRKKGRGDERKTKKKKRV